MTQPTLVENAQLPKSLIYYVTVIGGAVLCSLLFAWVASATWGPMVFFSVVAAMISLTVLVFGIVLVSIRMYQDANERDRRY